jgi:hypothetical protein
MKKDIAGPLAENLKEWSRYNDKLKIAAIEFSEVKLWLLEPRLTISQLSRILGIGSSVILNWHTRIIDKFNIPRPKIQKWAHFCLADLIFYEIVKEAKKRGVDVEKSMGIYLYIRSDFLEFENFVNLAKGNDYAIIYDFEKSDVLRFPKNPFAAIKKLATIPLLTNYFLTIPIGLVIRKLLQNHDLQRIFDNTFRIRVIKDNKLAITLRGKEAMLKFMPDKPDNLIIKNGVLTHILE